MHKGLALALGIIVGATLSAPPAADAQVLQKCRQIVTFTLMLLCTPVANGPPKCEQKRVPKTETVCEPAPQQQPSSVSQCIAACGGNPDCISRCRHGATR